MIQKSVLALAGALLAHNVLAGELVPRTWQGQEYGCRCYFGDGCWPKAEAWAQLNATVNGKLAVHVPPEAACHNTFEGTLGNISTYDAAECAEVTENWDKEQWT